MQTQELTKTRNIYSFTVFPDDLNYAGSLFGGKLLAEMDIAASNAARRLTYHSKCDGIVTAKVSEVNFMVPAVLGDIVELETSVFEVGRTSITVDVRATREDIQGKVSVICEASFVFVALKDKKPFPHGVSTFSVN